MYAVISSEDKFYGTDSAFIDAARKAKELSRQFHGPDFTVYKAQHSFCTPRELSAEEKADHNIWKKGN